METKTATKNTSQKATTAKAKLRLKKNAAKVWKIFLKMR